MSQFARFAPLLRREGFRKTWTSKAGGARTDEWRRDEPDGRTLIAQLWEDGGHRLNHEWAGCSNTAPTDFKTENQLRAAIKVETTRLDSRYANPDNHHVPGKRWELAAKRFSVMATQTEIDNAAVDWFAAALKEKLERSHRVKGRHGWHDPAMCSSERLAGMLIDHIEKGDPLDVGAFALFLWCREGGDAMRAVLFDAIREQRYREGEAP